MKYVVCCVRDRVADVFGQPMFAQSIGLAQRSFSDEVNRSADNNMLFRHSDDFSLHHLGEYDDTDASFVLLPKPRQLMLAKDCKVK